MAEENSSEVKQKSGLDLKIILIGLLIFLVAMGASYFLMKSLMAPLMPKDETKSSEEVLTGGLVSAGEFTTNVNDVAGNRYLKVEVSVEISDKEAEESVKEFMPIIRDRILTILSKKTVADLDASNRDNLKEEIKADLNSKLGKGYIKSVYFTNFIMQ